MNSDAKTMPGVKNEIDQIDDYLECVTYCDVEKLAESNDCQTICMERFLQGHYF